MIDYSRERYEDNYKKIEESRDKIDTMGYLRSDMQSYISEHNGSFDKFDFVNELVNRSADIAMKDENRLKTIAGEIDFVTDNSRSDYLDSMTKKLQNDYQMDNQQTKNAQAFHDGPTEIRGQGYRLQQPSNDIISGKKPLPDAVRSVMNTAEQVNERANYQNGPTLPGDVLK